jgi:SAM-dependent methyltransferase
MILSPDAVEAAAKASRLTHGPGLSPFADLGELRYRDELESWPEPLRDVPAFVERKQLRAKLDYALRQGNVRPGGTVVELGAGTCWLSGTLAARPEVERVIAVEFSERRLVELAPVGLAASGAPPDKVERRVADFYEHGLSASIADFVFMDAAFHHAADPVRLARVAYDLLKPGGVFVLFREPTLALLRRSRDHGEEGEHGSFEREYDWRAYMRFLTEAGFTPERHRASGGFATTKQRALLRPPLAWLNGILYSEFTYLGRKPL